MARKPRRGAPRPHSPTRPVTGAFQDLLRALTPDAEAEQDRGKVPAATAWGWVLTPHQGGFSVRPSWLAPGVEGTAGAEFLPHPQLPKWQWRSQRWSPEREGGWTDGERNELAAVAAGQIPEQGWLPLRHRVQWDHFWHSVRQGRPVAMHTTYGWVPVQLGAAVPADLNWHALEDGGLSLQPAGDADWAMVDGQAYAIDGPSDETPTEPVVLSLLEGDARVLNWAFRHGQITASEVAQWQARHAQDDRLALIPLPAELRPQHIDEAPQLVARMVACGDTNTAHLGLQMEVAYGPHRLPLYGPDLVTLTDAEGRATHIQRRRGQERRHMNELTRQNLRLWPHPFSKKDAFPLGWPVEWLAQQEATWISSEPPPTSLNAWFGLARQLEAAGVQVEWDAKIPFDRAPSQQQWTAHVSEEHKGKQRWLEAGVGVDIAGEQVDLTAALLALVHDPEFPLKATPQEDEHAVWALRVPCHKRLTYLDVPVKRLRALLAPLLAAEAIDGKSRVKLPSTALAEVQAWPTAVQLTPDLQTLWEAMQVAREPLALPDTFRATLRPYQVEGVAWLDFLARMGWGGILADDMGLGKTVQVLAHLVQQQTLHPEAGPALIVVPTSLLSNWVSEAAKFAPTLRVVTYYGQQRDALMAQIQDGHADIVLTTYGLMARDSDVLAALSFEVAFFDEAQTLKNSRSQLAKAARAIQAQRRVPITGTPVENHLGELWAQMDVAMPGLLGSREAFRARFQTPIEKHQDPDALARLRARFAPFVLRRMKSEVARDLPAKTETVLRLAMSEPQRQLYEAMRAQQQAIVQQAVAEQGVGGAQLVVLNALLRLRQVCCDPQLIGEKEESVKREHLMQQVDGLLEEGRQVLIVSQFTQMLDLLAGDLKKKGVSFELLTGDTAPLQRGACVERFQAGISRVFLASLKAGGVGLNLTAADTIIHYDPWWNPAAENQATDRIHRIGQDKPVFAYRLICQGTVEERIVDLQAHKSQLADAVLNGMGAGMTSLAEADLDALFAPMS